jgi:signal transduction histidine kinase/CheY-like chemotaxis protein
LQSKLKVIVWLLSLSCCGIASPAQVLDLSANNTRAIELDGNWEFYWSQQFTTNKQSDFRPDAHRPLHQHWTDLKLDGQTLPVFGYCTYRLLLVLPPQLKRKPALYVPHFYTAYRLHVNGVEKLADGVPGVDAATTQPHWSTQLLQLDTDADTLELVIQVSNFTHAKTGASRNIFIGDYQALRQLYNVNMTQDFFVAGCLLMGSLFFFGLFLFNRKEKSILYFALFCLAYTYRSVGTEFYALHNIFPGINYYLTLRLEYLTMPVGLFLYVAYLRALFPKEHLRWFFMFTAICCSVFIGVILFASPLVFTATLKYFLIVIVSWLPYGIFVFYRAHRQKRAGAFYGLLSFLFLSLLVIYSIANYFDLIPTVRFLELLAYLVFFLLQSMVLIKRSAWLYRQSQQAAEKGLAAKTDFLSTMSHEIRTPLNGVIGITQLLQRDDQNFTRQQKDYIETLAFSSNNLLAIVNDILDYEKLDAGKMRLEKIPMQPREIASRVIAAFQQAADSKQIHLQLTVHEAVPQWVMGDPTRTYQVLSNLLSNAIKFTARGGVSLNIGLHEMKVQKAQLFFEVADTGIGIAPEKLQHIFEPFTQADSSTSRSFGGTGLGLAICRNILHMQGATLQVKSEPGNGSRFSFIQVFDIAATPTTTAIAEPITAEKIVTTFSGHVLLVEDNKVNALVAVKFLEKWGLTADVAESGREALRIIDVEKHQLVLMDLQMPEMDGYEAAQAIRDLHPGIPIIALTANVAADVSEKVLRCGMNGIVSKPFKQEELKDMLRQYLVT